MKYMVPPVLKKDSEIVKGVSIFDGIKVTICGVALFLMIKMLPESVKSIVNWIGGGLVFLYIISLIPDPIMHIQIKKWIGYFFSYLISQKQYLKVGDANVFEEERQETSKE